jgi:hypothetical protein
MRLGEYDLLFGEASFGPHRKFRESTERYGRCCIQVRGGQITVTSQWGCISIFVDLVYVVQNRWGQLGGFPECLENATQRLIVDRWLVDQVLGERFEHARRCRENSSVVLSTQSRLHTVHQLTNVGMPWIGPAPEWHLRR